MDIETFKQTFLHVVALQVAEHAAAAAVSRQRMLWGLIVLFINIIRCLSSLESQIWSIASSLSYSTNISERISTNS